MPLERCPLAGKGGGQLLDQVDRAVLPAGAADGHRHIAAMVPRQSRQPLREEGLDVGEHAPDLGIGAHQDDLEFMAYEGILACYRRPESWFTGVVVTDGGGSPRAGRFSEFTNEQMKLVRRDEQRRAARRGGKVAHGAIQPGQLGELVLGSIKRDIGIKDMGAVLPGHGGILDRFNSLLLVSPAVFHLVKYLVGIGEGQPVRVFTG